MPTEHNNRLPPAAADKRRVLWRYGRQKNETARKFFAGHRKSEECSPKICDFRVNGIPVGERADFFDTISYFIMRLLSSETARSINSSADIEPRSPFSPRSLTESVPFSTSLSPIISIYGTFCSLASRIL